MLDYLLTVHAAGQATKHLRCTDEDKKDPKGGAPVPDDKLALTGIVGMVLAFVVLLAAIMNASFGKRTSQTFQADIVVAVLSPVMYWVLKAFRVLGVRE